MGYDPDTSLGGPYNGFPSTRQSLLVSATGSEQGIRREALGAIAVAYWKPVYKYIRLRWRKSNDEAKDLTQHFFAEMLDGSLLADFDPSRASFATYLRMSLDGFVSNQNRAAGRLKRGGGVELVSLDFEAAERELPVHANDDVSMEEYFHREWQREMFALAVEDLRALARHKGKDLQLRVFEDHDLVEQSATYADLARRHGIPETAVTNYLAWARRELRRLLLERLAEVTVGERDFHREARELFGSKR
jgi:RNA polymerase sigma factor (sigma-70 family)